MHADQPLRLLLLLLFFGLSFSLEQNSSYDGMVSNSIGPADPQRIQRAYKYTELYNHSKINHLSLDVQRLYGISYGWLLEGVKVGRMHV